MKLYDLELSGNCYKARMFLSMLNVDHDLVPVDLLGGEHKQPAYLAINPKGQVPALEDKGQVISDSQAILVYLALNYDADRTWLPEDPALQARIQYWLSTAANEVAAGPSRARLVKLFNMDFNYEESVRAATTVLQLIDDHLATNTWLAGDRPTIADVAVFPYLALAGDGGIDTSAYTHVSAWIDRFKALPGFIPMPGVNAKAA